jgi:hypothetical protein
MAYLRSEDDVENPVFSPRSTLADRNLPATESVPRVALQIFQSHAYSFLTLDPSIPIWNVLMSLIFNRLVKIQIVELNVPDLRGGSL